MPNVYDVIKFCRKKNILSGWTDGQIENQLYLSLNNNTLAFELDYENNITSVAFGYWISDNTIHATAMAGDLKKILKYVKDSFPTCEFIQCYRHGKKRIINTSKLFSKVIL